MRKLALVGCGAIGSAVIELLRGDAEVRVTQVIVPAGGHGDAKYDDCTTSIKLAYLIDPGAVLDTSCVAQLPAPFAP